MTGKREIVTTFKKGRKEDQRNTDPSASPLSGKIMEKMPLKLCTCGTGRWFRTDNTTAPRASPTQSTQWLSMMGWLQQGTRERLQMSFIIYRCHFNIKPLAQSPTASFSLDWREMDSMGGLLSGWGIGLTVISRGQWLRVPMDSSDKWCPSGVYIQTSVIDTSLMTWTKGSSAPLADLQMTPIWVAHLAHQKDRMPPRGTWTSPRSGPMGISWSF